MARKELSVTPREVTGKKVATLRRSGVLPANVYGHAVDSVSVQLNTVDLEHTIRAIAANEVIDLHIEGERAARPVVIHHIQRHPLNSSLIHADFYQVSLREKMRADVPLVLVGTSNAVEIYNGTLLTGMETVHIEALPLDVPSHIEVDISAIKELDGAIHVRDLKVPANVTVLAEGDVVVARVASPRVEEGDEPIEAPSASAEAEEEPEADAAAEEEPAAES